MLDFLDFSFLDVLDILLVAILIYYIYKLLKGTVAIWIFSFYNVQPIIILSITSIMWLLNFVLPAIIGSYFVLTFKPNFVK